VGRAGLTWHSVMDGPVALVALIDSTFMPVEKANSHPRKSPADGDTNVATEASNTSSTIATGVDAADVGARRGDIAGPCDALRCRCRRGHRVNVL